MGTAHEFNVCRFRSIRNCGFCYVIVGRDRAGVESGDQYQMKEEQLSQEAMKR